MSASEPLYPRSLLMHLRGFRQPLKRRVRHYLDRRVVENGIECVTLDDLQWAIGRAFEEMKSDNQVEPDVAFCNRAMQKYEAGEWRDIDDIIEDLQSASA